MRRERLQSNPVLGRRKLKLGTFQTNLDSGCVMSDLDGRIEHLRNCYTENSNTHIDPVLRPLP